MWWSRRKCCELLRSQVQSGGYSSEAGKPLLEVINQLPCTAVMNVPVSDVISYQPGCHVRRQVEERQSLKKTRRGVSLRQSAES